MGIARYFREDKVEAGGFAGVPQDDISDERWATLPAWLQEAVDASEVYQKTKPRTEPDPEPKRARVVKTHETPEPEQEASDG